MRVFGIACAAAGALMTLSCGSISPIAIHDGDQCFRCRRPIIEKSMAAELMDGNSFGSKFRTSGCMAKYLADHPGETGITFVTDYSTGKLVRSERKAREGRNPATGATIQIPAKTTLKFRVGKAMKDSVLPRK